MAKTNPRMEAQKGENNHRNVSSIPNCQHPLHFFHPHVRFSFFRKFTVFHVRFSSYSCKDLIRLSESCQRFVSQILARFSSDSYLILVRFSSNSCQFSSDSCQIPFRSGSLQVLIRFSLGSCQIFH